MIITSNKTISGITPARAAEGIRTVCVPLNANADFADGVRERFSGRIYSLWQRLGLVFLSENSRPRVSSVTENIVNNFSSRIIIQLFSNKRVRKAAKLGFPKNVFISVADRNKAAGKANAHKTVRSVTEKSMMISELSNIFELLSGRSGSSYYSSVNTLRAALTRFLSESSDDDSLTETESYLLDRLEQLLKRSVIREQTELLHRLMYIKETEKDSSVMKKKLLAAVSNYAQERNNIINTIVSSYSPRISELVQQFYNSIRPNISLGTVNSSISLRTVDASRNMLILNSAPETDIYRRDQPPTELRQRQETEPTARQSVSKKQALNIKSESAAVMSSANPEKLNREEIARLADKVYSQIEARLLRERRRIGL